jgi:cbb3-type cytochrome c oxidase subunit III
VSGRGLVLVVVLGALAAAASSRAEERPPRTGAEVWAAGCAACHGTDGAGRQRAVVGFDVRLPDLRDCTFVTAEPTPDWVAVVHEGGPVRGLDRNMPAFGGALSDKEIAAVVDYVRGFCRDLPDWPLGELNLPRPLFTDKAFPENEALLTSAIALRGPGSVMNELIYERRLGARSMFEIALPFGFLNLTGTASAAPGTAPSGWTGGIGDLGAALKHVVAHSARTGSIFSLGLDASIPSGRADRGLGAGVTILGPFAAYGQLLPARAFVQAQAGADVPVDFDKGDPEAFWRVALGWSFIPRPFGRMYSPMLEVLGTRALTRGSAVVWDLAPQLQATLNRRKHIRLNVGARLPVNKTEDRHVQLAAYLLWDWYEGSPLKGW